MALININEEKKSLVAIIAVVVIIISLFFIFRGSGGNPKIDLDRFTSLGQFTAEAVAEHLGSGKNVTVLTMDTSNTPALEKQHQSHIDTLKDKGIIVSSVQVIERDRKGPDPLLMEMGMIPVEKFLDAVIKAGQVDAIVSLVGVPGRSVQDAQGLPEDLAPIVVASSFGLMMSMRDLIEAGYVTMAITPKMRQSGSNTEKPKTHREWFDRYFQVVTEDNLENLAY